MGLSLCRFQNLKPTLAAAGVTNPLSARRGTGTNARSATFAASTNVEHVKEQYLQRWERYTSAHEYGHMIGLLDEYCPAVSPELIVKMYNEGQISEGEQKLSDTAKGMQH